METIIQVEQKLLNAILACDVATLDGLLHDSLLFNLPDGQTKGKAFDIETYRSGNMTVKSISARDRIINMIDENTAIVAVTVDLDAKWYDTPVDGSFRYLRVWKLFDGNWKVIAGSVAALAD